MTGSVAADGQTPMTGNLDMNSRKVVLLANGTVSTDAINLGQLTAAFTNPTFTGTGFMLVPWNNSRTTSKPCKR
jgi:hypothetical protein